MQLASVPVRAIGLEIAPRGKHIEPPMNELVGLPEWLGTAAIGAIIAALGYLAKTAIELITAARREQRERRAALVRLGSLLRATGVAFEIQNDLAQRLLAAIEKNHPDVSTEGGYERAISRAYPRLSEDELELHAMVRGYTINALKPTNEKILEWVREDTFFKSRQGKGKLEDELAQKLSHLEAHLLLWLAKYEAWIPNDKHHSLVYLADEQRHGLGFPTSIDHTVAQVLAKS